MIVDIEHIDESKNDIILNQLTSHEKKLAFGIFNSFRNRTIHSIKCVALQMFCTIKEVLSKIIKCGLNASFELLEIKSILQKESFYFAQFKKFQYYQLLSFFLAGNVCRTTYPKKTKLKFDALSTLNILNKFHDNYHLNFTEKANNSI